MKLTIDFYISIWKYIVVQSNARQQAPASDISPLEMIIPFCKCICCNWERGNASGSLGIHISELGNSVGGGG
jgi:hypothetical protein